MMSGIDLQNFITGNLALREVRGEDVLLLVLFVTDSGSSHWLFPWASSSTQGPVALNWTKSCQHADSFVSAARLSKSKSCSRSIFRCNAQLAELGPATSAAYGLLLLGGGLFAYVKSGSKGSLFGGFTGAAFMASAYFLMQEPDTKAIGDAVGFGSAFLFSSVFAIRLAATRKLTPTGPLLGLSIFALAVFISAYLQDSL